MGIPGSALEIRQLLSNRSYVWYVAGNLSSTLGVWVQRVAIGWLTWELTQSPAWLGAVMFAEAGPTIVLGLFAGALLDRVNQMRVLRITQVLIIAYSLALAVAVLTDRISIWLLFALVLFRGAVFAINRPARQTVVYALVGRDLLANALALNATVFNSSKFIGPALAGVAIVALGVGGTLVVALGLQFVFTLALARIGEIASTHKEREHRSMAGEIADGFRYIWANAGLRSQFLILAAISVLAKPITDLLPGFASDVLHVKAEGLAMLFAAHGLGAFIAGAWISVRAQRLDLVDLCAGCIVLVAVAAMAFAVNSHFWTGCALLFLIGGFIVCVDVGSQTIVQSAIRSRFRGRTMSSYGMVANGAPALGALVMGFAAERYGLSPVIGFGGALCLAAGVAAWLVRDRMKRQLREDESGH